MTLLAEELPEQGFLEGCPQALASPLLRAQLGVLQIQLQQDVRLEGRDKT